MTRHGYQGACENKEQSARGDSGNCAKSGPISPTLALQCDDDQAIVDQHGLTHADMVPILGTPSRVSEVLRGKKGLSMAYSIFACRPTFSFRRPSTRPAPSPRSGPRGRASGKYNLDRAVPHTVPERPRPRIFRSMGLRWPILHRLARCVPRAC
jgi:hypothetical protein